MEGCGVAAGCGLALPGGTVILGVDVSHYQPTSATWWRAASAAGIQFGIAKATQGASFTDPVFARNLAWMQANGILPGAYHFLVAGDGGPQADYFTSVIGQANPLLCVLDVEATGDNMANVQQFADRFKATGRTLIIYTGSWYWVGRMGNPDGHHLGPLWHAAYPSSRGSGGPAQQWASVNSTAGFRPGYGGWSASALWQFSDNAVIAGLVCDADAFDGTLDQLRALAGAPLEAEVDAAGLTAWATSPDGKKALAQALLAASYYQPYDGAQQVPVNDALTRLLTRTTALQALVAGEADAIAAAVVGKLGGSADAAAIKAAVRDVLVEGTGGTP